MDDFVNLIKLSVGTQSPQSLKLWQHRHSAQSEDGFPMHITRMHPRRGDEILNGGSIYWVIGGFIQVRQRIMSLDKITGKDGISRCAIVLHHKLVKTAVVPRRAFQGWRYLKKLDSPPDLHNESDDEMNMPFSMQQALADLGIVFN